MIELHGPGSPSSISSRRDTRTARAVNTSHVGSPSFSLLPFQHSLFLLFYAITPGRQELQVLVQAVVSSIDPLLETFRHHGSLEEKAVIR